ncbi:PAS domain-containing protein [Bradyrhizobium manausense]|uniref:sensor histidine kinase n=1 Tax=Bradyrhizobium manausense TaxID=989370 RepID=UPI001BAD6998|nr:sensor histidine kinase [Bradyrhizobium manausense]MBR1092038.1 PAS domain-containing protein [Bradyrhizobium manausense]
MTGLVWDVEKLRTATEAAGIALWSWNVDTDQLELDERGYLLWGVPNTGSITFEVLSACIHPEDLDRVRASFAATRDMHGAYETDFRILCDGKVRWISARGRGDDQGIVGRIMYGVFLDVTERKKAEEAREMLAGEMNHRVKNIFAITSALTAMSARSTTTKDEMVRDVGQRITALSIARDMVRPDLGQQKKAAELGELLKTLLQPYANAQSQEDRVKIDTPRLLVGEKSASALALVVHELATNSVKYGALSVANGVLDLECTVNGGVVTLTWRESGGPPISKAPGRSGFGSKLVVSSLSDQLGGSISASWRPTGAVITLEISEARLGA